MKLRDHPLELDRGFARAVNRATAMRGVYVDNVRLRATTWVPSVDHRSTTVASANEALRSAARRQH
jgi:hypothetical protein